MPRTLEQAVQILDRDLEEFLNLFPLSIFSAGQQKGVVRYYLYSLGETALGLNHGVPMTETKLRLGPKSLAKNSKSLQCIHIPVSKYQQLKPESISKVTHYDAADFLVTTQLVGCTFAIRNSKDGGLEFLHVQPQGNMDGVSVQQEMQKPLRCRWVKGMEPARLTVKICGLA